MNERNFDFYNNIGPEPLKHMAVIGGFSNLKDLEFVFPYIKDASVILEIGAGYGRCLDFFIQRNIPSRLIAIEQSPVLFDYLKSNYSDKATIIQADIKNVELNEKIDAALWMWSGIIDFSADEQKVCIIKISKALNPGGKIIIDIPRIGFQTYAKHEDEQNLVMESRYGSLYCHIPNEDEIRRIALDAGLRQVEIQHYKTDTLKERTVYILTK